MVREKGTTLVLIDQPTTLTDKRYLGVLHKLHPYTAAARECHLLKQTLDICLVVRRVKEQIISLQEIVNNGIDAIVGVRRVDRLRCDWRLLGLLGEEQGWLVSREATNGVLHHLAVSQPELLVNVADRHDDKRIAKRGCIKGSNWWQILTRQLRRRYLYIYTSLLSESCCPPTAFQSLTRLPILKAPRSGGD